jgi:putative tricarboxylic transport membrane protein
MAALARVVAPAGGLLLALLLLGATRGLDDVAREGQLGPGFWPRLVLGGLALTCAARLVLAWRTRAAREAAAGRDDAPPLAPTQLGGAIGLILLYVLVAPVAGFPLATAAFIAAFMAVAGARSPAAIAATAAAGTVGLLYVFVRIVYLPLPKGAGPFEDLTLALYRALGIF